MIYVTKGQFEQNGGDFELSLVIVKRNEFYFPVAAYADGIIIDDEFISDTIESSVRNVNECYGVDSFTQSEFENILSAHLYASGRD